MAPRLNPHHPPPTGFPSWAEFAAVTLLVVWLVALIALDRTMIWIHLLVPAAAAVLGVSLWNNRSPRREP